MPRSRSGSIAIGFTAAFGYGPLPEIVRRLNERAPNISLTLKEMVTSEQLEALDAGQLDVGLMRPHVPHGGLQTVLFGREALMLAIPEVEAKKWPQRPTLACLHRKPVIAYSPYETSYYHLLVQGLLERQDVKPDVVHYVPQIHTMLALVGSGIGAALTPQTASRLHFQGVLLRRVEAKPPRPVEMVFSCRRDNDNPILAIFRREVLETLDRTWCRGCRSAPFQATAPVPSCRRPSPSPRETEIPRPLSADQLPSMTVMPAALLPDTIAILDWLGALVFAFSGALVGVRKQFDLFGVLFLSFVVAVAGGMMRDVLIGALPPAAITEIHYFLIAILGGLVTFYWHPRLASLQRQILLFDAVGLGLFAVVGAQKAIEHGIHPMMAALLGMMTGIGGGMTRDVLAGDVPFVLRSDLYAVAALAGGAIVAAGYALGAVPAYSMLLGAAACIFLRIMAIYRGWKVPVAGDAVETDRK